MVIDFPRISVCIPIYNSNANSLVQQLHEQSLLLEDKVEILVIDDCSSADWKLKNESITNLCNYIQLSENIGRSKIRNLFLKYAKGEFLLFIDGDSEIISKNYLTKYLDSVSNVKFCVSVGGRINQKNPPSRNKLLRWKYSVNRESKSAEQRKSSYFEFQSNNFLIEKKLFLEIPFNEEISGYGHEDTLFGIQLRKKKCKIEHIDNPVLNKHLDTNDVFLDKTENAISNLAQIYALKDHFPEIREIKLIRFYEKMAKQKLSGFVPFLFAFVKPLLFGLLQNGFFMLWMFDLYKLGLFIRKIKS
jgi:glycosyltransferase involved in cell wall biosynthesis